MKQPTISNNSIEGSILAFRKKDASFSDITELFSMSPDEMDKQVTSILNELYGISFARAIKFLFDNVDLTVKKRFANTYMAPETLACQVTSHIEVEATSQAERLSPNIGRYVISVCTNDGRKFQLHFANQVSTVYFLMYLIDRKLKSGILPVIDLARNKSTFVSLYHAVYDKISHTAAQLKHQQLLYRVVGGKIRAGRKAEIEYDIRRQLALAFSILGDSPIPYGMSRHRHLTVSPDKIVFVGTAHRLLYLEFS